MVMPALMWKTVKRLPSSVIGVQPMDVPLTSARLYEHAVDAQNEIRYHATGGLATEIFVDKVARNHCQAGSGKEVN